MSVADSTAVENDERLQGSGDADVQAVPVL